MRLKNSTIRSELESFGGQDIETDSGSSEDPDRNNFQYPFSVENATKLFDTIWATPPLTDGTNNVVVSKLFMTISNCTSWSGSEGETRLGDSLVVASLDESREGT